MDSSSGREMTHEVGRGGEEGRKESFPLATSPTQWSAST